MAYGQNFTDTTQGFIGNGGILVSKINPATDRAEGGFFPLGQLSSASASFTSEKVEMLDLVYGTMGVARSKVIRNTGELILNLKSFNPEVLEFTLYGELTDDVAETGATYTEKAHKGKLIVVPGIIASVTSIKQGDVTLVEYEDFLVSNGSIEFLKSGSVIDGEDVTVVYDKAAVRRLEGMVKSGVPVMIVFDGKNLAEDDAAVKVTYYKVMLSPSTDRSLISSDFSEHQIKGTIEASRAVNGTGLSKMFKEEYLAVA